jgi:hypothetical protein
MQSTAIPGTRSGRVTFDIAQARAFEEHWVEGRAEPQGGSPVAADCSAFIE